MQRADMTIDGEGLARITIPIDGMRCRRCVDTVRSTLAAIPGIVSTDVIIGEARVSHVPQLVSIEHIEKLIEDAGYAVRRQERKGPVRRFIDRMIKSNQKAFGNERLDCCNLPRDHQP